MRQEDDRRHPTPVSRLALLQLLVAARLLQRGRSSIKETARRSGVSSWSKARWSHRKAKPSFQTTCQRHVWSGRLDEDEIVSCCPECGHTFASKAKVIVHRPQRHENRDKIENACACGLAVGRVLVPWRPVRLVAHQGVMQMQGFICSSNVFPLRKQFCECGHQRQTRGQRKTGSCGTCLERAIARLALISFAPAWKVLDQRDGAAKWSEVL